MQLKKNPKADLTKNSSLYFAIGLASVLFISWQAIEWKTYDKTGYGYEALNVEDDDELFELKNGNFAIDGAGLLYVAGTTIDFKKEVFGSYMQISNPNATSSCGCGESFAV